MIFLRFQKLNVTIHYDQIHPRDFTIATSCLRSSNWGLNSRMSRNEIYLSFLKDLSHHTCKNTGLLILPDFARKTTKIPTTSTHEKCDDHPYTSRFQKGRRILQGFLVHDCKKCQFAYSVPIIALAPIIGNCFKHFSRQTCGI